MNIFVGNLAFTTTEQELRACFEAYGTVETGPPAAMDAKFTVSSL